MYITIYNYTLYIYTYTKYLSIYSYIHTKHTLNTLMKIWSTRHSLYTLTTRYMPIDFVITGLVSCSYYVIY